LGLTSFGGPVAHLGYFHDEFVVRRKWLDERAYADLVALCQFLPGPASSQVGMGVGLSRAGLPGAVAAWTAFTMPSAIALILFGYGVTRFGDAARSGALHGLKVVAVAVVAQAVCKRSDIDVLSLRLHRAESSSSTMTIGGWDARSVKRQGAAVSGGVAGDFQGVLGKRSLDGGVLPARGDCEGKLFKVDAPGRGARRRAGRVRRAVSRRSGELATSRHG
jgi:hypothetical protein